MTLRIPRTMQELSDQEGQIPTGTPGTAKVKTHPRAFLKSIIAALLASWLIPGLALPTASGQAASVNPAGPTPASIVPTALSEVNGTGILSDTRGVNFGPYLKGVSEALLKQWAKFLPEKARKPTFAPGDALIRFTILPDGSLAPHSMHLDASTHDDEINRAAWGAITSQKQFHPLPKAFTGPNLEIRILFTVNEPASR